MGMLEKAIELACRAHDGQIDKGGNSYILHPLRVMMNMPNNEEMRIIAVLHDVVEDSSYTLSDLKLSGFNENIIAAVDALTRRNDESYMDFINRCKQNYSSKLVKITDIVDNLDIKRIINPTEKDYERMKKYNNALSVLTES